MKNKRVLIIKGSARKEGYTNRLCDRVQELLSDNQIVVFDTFDEKFLPCNGCNYCEKNGRCVHRDLDVFFEQFENADLIIFASPVYNGTFSAPLKGLIDRFQTYYTRFYASGKVQPIKKRRRAIFIAAAGRDGKKSFDFMKWQLSCAFSILNVEFIHSVLCPFTDTEPRYDEALEELKRSFTYE
ncbi:MAG: flavodoxin family protein [Clostridia bacterium]|nr:flavodoxin family protein [Clostridia bacterium]